MEELLPDRLKRLWEGVDAQSLTKQEFEIEHMRGLDEFRQIWAKALRLKGHGALRNSLLWEVGEYVGCQDLAEVERRAKHAMEAARDEWHDQVKPDDKTAVERYYDTTDTSLYELMWWHTLSWDESPLAYVTALKFAQQQGCQTCLDFGSGVGSGAILLKRHDISVTLADISSPLLRFCAWRFNVRGLPVEQVDLKEEALPEEGFDLILAMDVFEHLYDPVSTVAQLSASLKPGGFLFGRFGVEDTEDQPQHIVHDFAETLEAMTKNGLVPAWQDEWLWGHQAFRKM
jgi:mycofactocin glycosyltransferase